MKLLQEASTQLHPCPCFTQLGPGLSTPTQCSACSSINDWSDGSPSPAPSHSFCRCHCSDFSSDTNFGYKLAFTNLFLLKTEPKVFFFFYSRKNFDLCKEAEQTAAGWSNIHKEESAVCSFIALFVLQPPSRALFPQYNIIAYYITCLSAASPATCWWQWTAPDSQTTSGWDRHWARCLLISRLHICGKKRMLSREIGTRLS